MATTRSPFRKALAAVRAYVPGKPIEAVRRELGLVRIEKLASNENPLGPSPVAVEAVTRELVNLHLYPDPSAKPLMEALAARTGLPEDHIVVTNGGEQLLQLIAQVFIDEGDEALMARPSFDLYTSTVTLMGGRPVPVDSPGFAHDLDAFLARVTPRTKIAFVCSPNNPTGNIVPRAVLERFAEALPEQVVLVIDEAYYDYAVVNPDYHDGVALLRRRPHTLLIRTFSKVGGIAGLRVGYALTAPAIAAELLKIRGTFSVNRLAQAAALGVLHDPEHIQKTVALNYESMASMQTAFDHLGLPFVRSNANFVWVDVGRDSRGVFDALQRRGVIVRPGFLWGCDSWLRVSTGTMVQTAYFVHHLAAVLGALTG